MSRRSSATSGSAAARLSTPGAACSILIFDILPALLAASLFFCHAQSAHLRRAHTCRPSLPAHPGSPCQGSPCLALMTGREHFPYARTAPTRNAHCRSDDRPPPPPLTPARALSHCCAPRTTARAMCRAVLRRRMRGTPRAEASVTAAWATCSPCSRRRPWRPASPWRRALAGRR
jgi:hypothetical protein